MIVVDSSVWIGLFADVSNPQIETFRSIRDRTRILVGDVILLEVLRGARSDRLAMRIETELRKFDLAAMVGPTLAVRAAANYRQLRSRGITISKAVDLIIATYCIEHDHQLLHRDRDFDHFEQHLGLRVLR